MFVVMVVHEYHPPSKSPSFFGDDRRDVEVNYGAAATRCGATSSLDTGFFNSLAPRGARTSCGTPRM
jgi:hypothetical protein